MPGREFQLSCRWWDTTIWGGGHTTNTCPPSRGWKTGLVGYDLALLLVGRPRKPGCFTVRVMGNGDLDVAVYNEVTPEQIIKMLKAGEALPGDAFYAVRNTHGWGLQFVQEIENSEQR